MVPARARAEAHPSLGERAASDQPPPPGRASCRARGRARAGDQRRSCDVLQVPRPRSDLLAPSWIPGLADHAVPWLPEGSRGVTMPTDPIPPRTSAEPGVPRLATAPGRPGARGCTNSLVNGTCRGTPRGTGEGLSHSPDVVGIRRDSRRDGTSCESGAVEVSPASESRAVVALPSSSAARSHVPTELSGPDASGSRIPSREAARVVGLLQPGQPGGSSTSCDPVEQLDARLGPNEEDAGSSPARVTTCESGGVGPRPASETRATHPLCSAPRSLFVECDDSASRRRLYIGELVGLAFLLIGGLVAAIAFTEVYLLLGR